MNSLGPFRLALRVKPKNNGHNFAPISPFISSIKQPKVRNEMTLVICRQFLALRRTILERGH